jgi:putative ABC transport system substrate-binding protein
VAVLEYQSSKPVTPGYDQDLATAARALNVTLQHYGVGAPEELDDVFAVMKKARAEALVVMPDSFMWQNAQRIVNLAAQNRLPAVYPGRAHVEAGGLLAYDLDESATYGRVGHYVDQILRGAKPGDLPVEQPTKFEVVVNLKTAGALGLTLPPSLLLRADRVIR